MSLPRLPSPPAILVMLIAAATGPIGLRGAEPAAPPPAAAAGDDADDTHASTEAKPDPSAERFWQAMKLLQSKAAPDQEAGRKALQEASDLEYVHAQTMLGYCYLSGSYGFRKDPRKAVSLFRLAAERGNAYAMVSLGSCYVTGTGTRQDDAKAEEWLAAALADKADFSRPVAPPEAGPGTDAPAGAVAGELATDPEASSRASAHFLLAQIESRRKRPAEAQAHYVAAATAGIDGRSGIYQAAVEAAINYAFGRGIPRDAAKADELLDQSRRLVARSGVNLIHSYVALKFVDEFAVADLEEQLVTEGANQRTTVQYEIANSFADKKSKDYNAAEAARWYQLASDNDQVWATLALGLMYSRGDLGTPDYAKAFALFEKAGGGEKPKHALGIANLAICLRQGLGTAKDEALAAELAKKFRAEEIVCYLLTIGQAPTKPIDFAEELRLIQTWAKEKADPVAQFLLARRYFQGDGVKQNPDEGFSLLKKAAKARQGEALCLLGWIYQFKPDYSGLRDRAKALKTAADCYRTSGEVGNIEGLANYAVCLSNGWGVARDVSQAIATYEKCLALDPHHSRSHSNLGEIYQQKILEAGTDAMGTAEWRTQMLAHYEASLQTEASYAAVKLALLYYQGRIVKQDLDKAYRYFEQAATVPLHKSTAHFYLGYMHELGQSVPVTYSEAAYHYRLAALEGNIEALRRLVNFYVTGVGVSLDFDRAIYWLTFLMRLGDYSAMTTTTDVLIKKGDYANAAKLLESMTKLSAPALAGHAHQRLWLLYSAGQGVKKSPRAAERHFQAAVKLGNGDALRTVAHRQFAEGKVAEGVATMTKAAESSADAAYNLGQMYFFGDRVAADRTRAIQLLNTAAVRNNTDAMIFLSGLTWNREKEAPSINEAIDLAAKAESMGNPRGAPLREKLEKRRKANGDQPQDDGRARAG